jgi:exodeoxyribonuclease VII small subunit
MELTYEEAIKALEETVEKLENSDVSLEESIQLFEKGTQLVKICNDKLNTAEQKFTQLLNKDSQE